jgi:pimeloyl-ACP methyl ester carboxylesterase
MGGVTRRSAVLGLAGIMGGVAQAAPPAVGTLAVYPQFASSFVAPRTVWVWSPPQAGQGRRLPVIYMHDGQNLFDADLAAFGEWGVDEALTALSATTGTQGAIVVGIANTSLRRQEYLPETYLAQIAPPLRSRIEDAMGGPALSEAYLAFLTEELKPFIEANHPVQRRRQGVFSMGSSMGGLISLEAVIRRPDVFGGAGCLSTHWPLRLSPFESAEELVSWQEGLLPAIAHYVGLAPPPGRARLWFDHGDQNLDRWYRPYQIAADAAFLARGYALGDDFQSRFYPGTDHNETSWRARLEDPLRFLLGVEA